MGVQLHIPVELLDLCEDAEWTYHRPTLLTTDPSMETSPINQLHSASAFFEIPADEPLYLLSQGNFSYGTVEFVPAAPESGIPQDVEWSENGRGGVKTVLGQKIRVEVDAKYRDPSVFDWARVCMIGGENVEDGAQGAGGEPRKPSLLSRVGVMVWVSLTGMSPPSSSSLIIFRFTDPGDQRCHTQRVSASFEDQSSCSSKARIPTWRQEGVVTLNRHRPPNFRTPDRRSRSHRRFPQIHREDTEEHPG